MDKYSGEKKPKKSTKTKKPKSSTKSRLKKGGNFMGAIGDLVAPTGWGPFATAAGLLAVDHVSTALRRGTKKKKMEGGRCDQISAHESTTFLEPISSNNRTNMNNTFVLKNYNVYNPKYKLVDDIPYEVTILCNEQKNYVISIKITCKDYPISKRLDYIDEKLKFDTLEEAKKWIDLRKNQISYIGRALLHHHKECKNSDYNKFQNNSSKVALVYPVHPHIVSRPGLVRTHKKGPINS